VVLCDERNTVRLVKKTRVTNLVSATTAAVVRHEYEYEYDMNYRLHIWLSVLQEKTV